VTQQSSVVTPLVTADQTQLLRAKYKHAALQYKNNFNRKTIVIYTVTAQCGTAKKYNCSN